MPYRPLRVVVTDWGNRRGRIFSPTGFAPLVRHKTTTTPGAGGGS